MAYSPEYGYTDIVSIVFDFLGATFVGMISQAGPFGSLIIVTAILGLIALVVGKVFGVIKEFLRFSHEVKKQ